MQSRFLLSVGMFEVPKIQLTMKRFITSVFLFFVLLTAKAAVGDVFVIGTTRYIVTSEDTNDRAVEVNYFDCSIPDIIIPDSVINPNTNIIS